MKEITGSLDGHGNCVGIVRSRFNQRVGKGLLESCHARLLELGVDAEDITVVTVPGALEIPLALQQLAASGEYQALIALGAVIRGETYHFEIVCNQSASGISAVALDCGLPVANGILTTDTDAQADARIVQKGRDCAEAAVEMANLGKTLFQED